MGNQDQRNAELLKASHYMGTSATSQVLPLHFDIDATSSLTDDQVLLFEALQIESARTSIRSLASLSKIGEVDHLGGGLDLIPSFLLTLALTDYKNTVYTIEHAHTSIGYYSALAALGFLDPTVVVEQFRRGIDIPGHVSWVPGGTELNGGRLGVMIPVAVGQALGMRAHRGDKAWSICHCGDAGWISGQALNGFNGADLHNAPITFVMHRNGLQLSDSNKHVMDKDPRPIIEAMGITIVETPTIMDVQGTYAAYRQARDLARQGRPSLIYPTGFRSEDGEKVTLKTLAEQYGIGDEVGTIANKNDVSLDTEIWIPGALMSYRDVHSMLECVFLVNELPGGKDHHDGHMKGRDEAEVLGNPMLQMSDAQEQALAAARAQTPTTIVTTARPAPGTPNLVLSADDLADVDLPPVGKDVSARGGSEAGYAAVAKAFPNNVFVVSCDLDPSTKLGKARGFLKPDHQFEMSIEEQVSALMADGLALSTRGPQLNVFSTFAAFYEGIAREGFEVWRYQRNLNGSNEGLNVCLHLSHVGACTGRDHFSGWSLDWITLSLGYLPYLRGFYAPADARAAFVAVRELAAGYGGHIIGIPRDNLPILEKQDGSGPLWEADTPWEAITEFRTTEGAKRAILALGSPAFVAADAATQLAADGLATDVHIVNGFPLPEGALDALIARYPDGIVTIEDGIIATRQTGLRGFAGVVSSAAYGSGVPLGHVGITDPCIAPADGHMETWEHFGITAGAVVEAMKGC